MEPATLSRVLHASATPEEFQRSVRARLRERGGRAAHERAGIQGTAQVRAKLGHSLRSGVAPVP